MKATLPSGTPAVVFGDPGERGLVMMPDIFGLRPLSESLGERLAADWSCRVCVVELYPGLEHLELEARFEAASEMDDRRILGDMVDAADLVGGDRVGAIGFCMGGMYALKAASTRRFDRIVPFYGMIRVPPTWRGAQQEEPLDHISRGDPSAIMAVVGQLDPYTPVDEVAELRSAGVDVVSYEFADHGFVHDPGRPAHRPADAADAWHRADQWLWDSADLI